MKNPLTIWRGKIIYATDRAPVFDLFCIPGGDEGLINQMVLDGYSRSEAQGFLGDARRGLAGITVNLCIHGRLVIDGPERFAPCEFCAADDKSGGRLSIWLFNPSRKVVPTGHRCWIGYNVRTSHGVIGREAFAIAETEDEAIEDVRCHYEAFIKAVPAPVERGWV